MTNDQKFLLLISKTDELLKALDKQDETKGSSLYRNNVNEKRKDMRIWLNINKIVTTTNTPPVRKRIKPTTQNFKNNWLGQ
jgi:hypothetical protein